jgi:dethiobiotin synthetase
MRSETSHMHPLFITGIGTGIGKTVVAAIVTEALNACYWKPVQAGLSEGTDTGWVGDRISHPEGRLFPETYKLSLAASPHIAAREEGLTISLDKIAAQFDAIRAGTFLTLPFDHPPVLTDPAQPPASGQSAGSVSGQPSQYLVIEGAGGLLVPLNDQQFVLDLVKRLDATVLLVSRNYLGSINHSLLTAAACRAAGLRTAGWIFNDRYGQYEQEIARWSGIPSIASVPFGELPGPAFIRQQADLLREPLLAALLAG